MPIKIAGFVCDSCRLYMYCYNVKDEIILQQSGWMLDNNKVYCPTCTMRKINRIIIQTSKMYPTARYIQILELLALDMREHAYYSNSTVFKSVKSMYNYLKKGSKCRNTQRLQQKD